MPDLTHENEASDPQHRPQRTRESGSVSVFDRLIACSREHFVAQHWGQRHFFETGPSDRYAHVLDWAQINRVLAEHRLDFPRLRLAKRGQTLPAQRYLEYRRARRGADVPVLKHAELQSELRDGATLIIDAIEECCAGVQEVASALEREFHEKVWANAYCSWQPTEGFGAHWDDHDVFVLQVAGRKHWDVFGCSRQDPMYVDVERDDDCPSAVVWQGELLPGSLLYMPRGCWHAARASGDPSLHLTFGMSSRTGISLAKWLAEQLRADPFFRQPVPRLQAPIKRRRYEQAFARRLQASLGDQLLNSYEAFLRGADKPRPAFSLPLSAMDDVAITQPGVRFRWLPVYHVLHDQEGTVELWANNRKLHVSPPMEGLVRSVVAANVATPVALLLDVAAASGIAEAHVRALLVDLLDLGLIALSSGSDGS